MILAEFSGELPSEFNDKFVVYSEGNILALLVKNCVDEWLYDSECASKFIESDRTKALEIFEDFVKKTVSEGLQIALLTPSPSLYSKLFTSLVEEKVEPFKDLYAIYIRSLDSLLRSGFKILIPFMLGDALNTSLPVEVRTPDIDRIAERLRRFSYDIKIHYIYNNDLLAFRM
jgi:hypothetical protein